MPEEPTYGEQAKQSNHPVGSLGCPHCGITSTGDFYSTICQVCEKDMFEGIKKEVDGWDQ